MIIKKSVKPKKKSDDSWMKCCKYCKNFRNGMCTSSELVGGSEYADNHCCAYDGGYVFISNPDTFYCSAWE